MTLTKGDKRALRTEVHYQEVKEDGFRMMKSPDLRCGSGFHNEHCEIIEWLPPG